MRTHRRDAKSAKRGRRETPEATVRMSRFLTLVTFLVLVAPGMPGQQKPAPPAPEQDSIGLESHLVLLNISVTDAAGRFTHGLHKEDFQVFDQGDRQQIAEFGSEETPFAAAILLDISGSQDRMFRIGRAAARQFAGGLRPDDVYAVYVFAGKVARVQEFGNAGDVEDVLWTIRPDGRTALYDAVAQAAKDLGARPEKRRAMLILTDGDDTASSQSQDTALRSALDAGITIHTVNLLDENTPSDRLPLARSALKNMAEKTGGRSVEDRGGAVMYQAFKDIVDELSHQYTISYAPLLDRHDGKWHKIEVKLAGSQALVRTRQGYYAPKKER